MNTIKRFLPILFLLLVLPSFLTSCIIDQDTPSIIESIKVEPRSIQQSELSNANKFVVVTVELKPGKTTDGLDLQESYLFLQGDDQSRIKGVPKDTPKVTTNTITFTIAYTWLHALPEIGEHHIAVHLKFPKTSITEDSKQLGIYKIIK